MKIDKNIQRYRRVVTKINKLEEKYQKLANNEFVTQTSFLKMQLESGEGLKKILPEAYALVREAAKRVTGMRAYNVQLIGAIAASDEKIAEMKTGEGKTLTIIFPAYLNSLERRGVHVVTANDYLAERDATKMKPIYDLLGVSIGFVTSKSNQAERQIAYGADITYVTNNEIGFDFLKDNMLYDVKNKVQRDLHYALVDEADSVLIDEAQTPLVISDAKKTPETDKLTYSKLNPVVKELRENIDFRINYKEHVVSLTVDGIKKLESLIGVENLYQDGDVDYIYFVERLLKAHTLFRRDRDYIVDKGKVIIVDEFTGRLMDDHRYHQGLHQAIEIKEGLEIQDENQVLASITFQHLFKRYRKLAGLTGTAREAKKEFRLIYGKQVVVIPTNKPVIRKDNKDRFFLSWEDKINYLTWHVKEHYFKKRPSLIGTRSVRKSFEIYQSLITENVPSNILNAKHNAQEAEVISRAGQPQTVTVATNMAGRGTDIDLHEDVRKDLGLVVIGTERHNAQRIDNQLIGRSGRQGDPGWSQFLVSADDELLKTYFKSDYIKEIEKIGNYKEGVESPKLKTIINKAQKRMESVFFDQRLLNYEFDKVLDSQRKSFYRQRNRVLFDEDLKEETLSLIKKEAYRVISRHHGNQKKNFTRENIEEIINELQEMVNNQWFKPKIDEEQGYSVESVRDGIYQGLVQYYNDFENYVSSRKMRMIEKTATLKVLDLLWIDFLNKVEEIQDAALISSISKADFFDDYRVKMAMTYKNMLKAVPRAACLTIFRMMNRFLEAKIQSQDPAQARDSAQKTKTQQLQPEQSQSQMRISNAI